MSVISRSWYYFSSALLIGMALTVVIAPTTSHAQTIRTYSAQFTQNAIVADGIISPGEWDGADTTSGGGWNEIRQPFGDADTQNNSFQMLWDDTNLYIRWQNSDTSWFDRNPDEENPTVDFGIPSLNLYFDPNTDGDPNDVPDSDVAGYQIAYETVSDPNGGQLISTNADRDGVGFFTEAHVGGLFGNQAEWGGAVSGTDGQGLGEGSGITVGHNNQISGADAGGLGEIIIPWDAFDALAQIDDGAGGMIDTGLNHTSAPVNNETWFFNIATISSDFDNFLPAWNYTGSQFFSSHGDGGAPNGHGEITFVGKSNALAGDFDGDQDVDGSDFLVWQQGGSPNPLSPADLTLWKDTFGNVAPAAIAAVPEPSTTILFILAAALCTVATGRCR